MDKDRAQQRPRSTGLSGSSPVLRQPGSSTSAIVKKAEVPANTAKKKRSTLEIVVVWGLIGGLCFVAIVEAAGKLSYDRAFKSLQAGLDEHSRSNQFTIDAALAKVKRPAQKVALQNPTQEAYEWRWPSFFKTYRLRIVASTKDHVISNLETGDDSSRD